jgi:hypothetical protein
MRHLYDYRFEVGASVINELGFFHTFFLIVLEFGRNALRGLCTQQCCSSTRASSPQKPDGAHILRAAQHERLVVSRRFNWCSMLDFLLEQ